MFVLIRKVATLKPAVSFPSSRVSVVNSIAAVT